MPVITHLSTPAEGFVSRLSENEDIPTGELIQICAEFQRGDEDTGVWPEKMRKDYIDSLLRGYPTGVTMLVKPPGATHTTKWMILDGANRARALRDFMTDVFPTHGRTGEERKVFSELTAEEQARMKNQQIFIQQVRVTRTDPVNVIADLFQRVNTKVCRLAQGELIKAHGWLRNVPTIELAKSLVGGKWNTVITDEIPEWVVRTRERWQELFPAGTNGARETKRCNNLATMCGLIISALMEDIGLLDSDYRSMQRYLIPGQQITAAEATTLSRHFSKFLEIIAQIPEVHTVISSQCGMPKKKKMFPLWGFIIENRMTPQFTQKLIAFYTDIQENTALLLDYNTILCLGGDSHITNNKLTQVYNLINSFS
jgi:hypothetical protein